MRDTRRSFLCRGAAAAAASCGVGRIAVAQAPVKAIGAQPVNAVNYLPQIVGVTRNYFASEGLDFKLITSGGGSKLREIVAAGQVQFGFADSSHVIQLNNRGKPAKMVMGVDTRPAITNIVIRKDLFDRGINSVEKLAAYKRPAGAKPIIAVSTFGGGQHVYAGYLFEKLGVYSKMNWLAGGGTATMLGGLQSQKFDAIVASPAWQLEAVTKNFGRVIFDATKDNVWNSYFGGPIPSTCAYVLQSTIDTQPEIVQAYVNGLYRAMAWLERASTQAIWEATGEKWFGDLGKEITMKEIAYLAPLFNYSGLISPSSFTNAGRVWFRDITEMKPVSYADAVDMSFLGNSRRKYG